MRLGFGIWAEIPLFRAVALMRIIAWVNDEWFGIRFDHGRTRGGDCGGVVILL